VARHPELYGNRRWRRVRRVHLLNNPACVYCGARSTVVDHRTPHRGDAGLFWDSDNYDAVCTRCHNTVCDRKDKGKSIEPVALDGTREGWE